MALGGGKQREAQRVSEPQAMPPVERARAIRRATALTHRERVVLLELSDMQGDNAECWPAQATLAEYTGVDDRNLRRLFTKLAAEGWLVMGRTTQGLRSYSVTVPETGRVKATLPSGSKQPGHPGQNNPGQNNPAPGSKQPAPPGHPDPAPRVKTTLHGTNQELIRGTKYDPTPDGVGGARATPEPEPDRPRRRDALDYAGQPAAEAQAALSAACVAAGGVPRTRGGFAAQSAWSQAACDADELAGALGLPVAQVLETAARGFVAVRGAAANPQWWHERFAEYFEAGRKGAPRKAGMHRLPDESAYRPTTDAELDAMFGPEVAE